MDINFSEDVTVSSSDGAANTESSASTSSSSVVSASPSVLPRRPSSSNGYNADDKRLFVGNLNYDITEAVLREYFSKFGAIFGVYIKFNMLHCPFDVIFPLIALSSLISKITEKGEWIWLRFHSL
jgi:RNA recognition motif-containing protein